MTKLYNKNELWFSIIFIIIYVLGTSLADTACELIGIKKSVTVIFHLVLSSIVVIWIRRNRLVEKYGLVKSRVKASFFLYYFPLFIFSSVNLWFGIKFNITLIETIFYLVSMLCVGFLEEIIFRGFLFKAMAKDNLKSAVIVSSLTFGIGHMINLVNSSGADIVSNLCQVCYAVAFGWLFVTIYILGSSLIPCIVCHSAMNMLSVFANDEAFDYRVNISVSAILCLGSVLYTLFLRKKLKLIRGKDNEYR